MSKCSSCRQIKLDTLWDKFRSWWLKHLFQQDLQDEKNDSYTQGISDGMVLGAAREREHLKELYKRLFNVEL
jgi:hypothetical protein